jgi:hypothetical protein
MFLEDTIQRLEAEMERRRAAELTDNRSASISAANAIMEHQAAKDPALAAKQARLLKVLKGGLQ